MENIDVPTISFVHKNENKNDHYYGKTILVINDIPILNEHTLLETKPRDSNKDDV